LRLLKINPFSLSLKTHKVINKSSDLVFSSKATGDIRIIWNFSENEVHVIDILDIGGHEGCDKVYK
jgi:hypothetical protein